MWRNPEKLLLEPPIEQPPIVLDSIRILRRLINQAPNLHFDDPRANLIEPQLAFANCSDLIWISAKPFDGKFK